MSIDASGAAAVERTPDELVGRLFDASLGMFDVMAVYLGDQLGLYRALRDGGAATSSDLAGARRDRRTVCARVARAAGRDRDPRGGRRRRCARRSPVQPPGGVRRAAPRPDQPVVDQPVRPLRRRVRQGAAPAPDRVQDRRRRAVGGLRRGHDRGAGRLQPALAGQLFGSEILPAIPDVHGRLVADPPARVADVACGVGWAAIAIATAYPGVRVDGFDLDDSSIELARQNAEAAGVADRVTFEVRDIAPRSDGTYDVVVIIEAVHDMSRPADVARLGPPGPAAGRGRPDRRREDGRPFTAPADDTERAYYGFSVFTCLPAAMTERPTAAIGTVHARATMRAPRHRGRVHGCRSPRRARPRHAPLLPLTP